jgi:hypothetical protein
VYRILRSQGEPLQYRISEKFSQLYSGHMRPNRHLANPSLRILNVDEETLYVSSTTYALVSARTQREGPLICFVSCKFRFICISYANP